MLESGETKTTREELIAAARFKATQKGLDPLLVCGICEQESAWNPWLTRYEPSFESHPAYGPRVKQDALNFVAGVSFTVTKETEIKLRCISWGLMQVMGQTARERGYKNPLAQLSDPWEGLEMGCAIFAFKLGLADLNVERALQMWNGGGNPNYAAEVLARVNHYR